MVPCRDARFCVCTMHSTYVTNFSHITNNSQPGYRNVLQLRPTVVPMFVKKIDKKQKKSVKICKFKSQR